MYIVSACLLGANCKYNGGNNDNEAVKDFCEGHKVLVVCPETAGGLTAPRPPAEQVKVSGAGAADARIMNNEGDNVRILNSEGEDVTEYFLRGAEICFNKVMAVCGHSDQDGREENDGTERGDCEENNGTGRGDCKKSDGKGSGDCKEDDGAEVSELAILKANSPSCGSGCIYDGTFTGTLTEGDGVFAAKLKEVGIKVLTELDIEQMRH